MIRGQKVVLREKRLEDALQDYAWKSDPELAQLDATLPLQVHFKTYLLTYAEELDSRADSRGHVYAIDTLDGTHIGNCCFYNVDRSRKEAEVGILIGNPAYWDAGYGTDAVKALLDHVFRKEGLRRVYLHTLTWNARAQKSFKKCGFSECGRVTRSGYDFMLMEMKRPAKHLMDDRLHQPDVPRG